MRALVVEGDVALSGRITEKLTDAGFLCDSADNLRDGEYYFDIRHYDLILLDWALVQDGDFVASIHRQQPSAALLVLSGTDDSWAELTALREGADDYLHKPFELKILLARIEACLRRCGVSHLIEIGELTIDSNKEQLSFNDKPVELKGKSYEVFVHLALHRDLIVSKEQLLDAIWDEPELVTPNVIEVAISQIREKVDKPLGITTIETVRRRGYRFCYDD